MPGWSFCRSAQTSPPEHEDLQPPQSDAVSIRESPPKAATGSRPPSSAPEQHDERRSEDGYEVMNKVGPRAESLKANIAMLKGSSSPSTGGAVNLILSFNKTGDSQVQVLDPPSRGDVKMETSEPLHRVRIPLDTRINT